MAIKAPVKHLWWSFSTKMVNAQNMKFSIKDLFSKCDQIRRKLRIWSHLLKKSIKENFIFHAVSQSRIFDMALNARNF